MYKQSKYPSGVGFRVQFRGLRPLSLPLNPTPRGNNSVITPSKSVIIFQYSLIGYPWGYYFGLMIGLMNLVVHVWSRNPQKSSEHWLIIVLNAYSGSKEHDGTQTEIGCGGGFLSCYFWGICL